MTVTLRTKSGDVLEVKTAAGSAYLHYVGKHAEYGDTVRVAMGKYAQRPADMSRLFEGAYVAFYPVRAAVSQGFIEVAGWLKGPPDLPPTRLRRPGARSGSRVETWVIEDGTGQVVKNRLSDEERQLPIAAIWNHEMLLLRLVENWTPEIEG